MFIQPYLLCVSYMLKTMGKKLVMHCMSSSNRKLRPLLIASSPVVKISASLILHVLALIGTTATQQPAHSSTVHRRQLPHIFL